MRTGLARQAREQVAIVAPTATTEMNDENGSMEFSSANDYSSETGKSGRLRCCNWLWEWFKKLNLFAQDKEWTITSVQVDRCSMIIFPLSFLIFNITYWSIYFSKIDRPM